MLNAVYSVYIQVNIAAVREQTTAGCSSGTEDMYRSSNTNFEQCMYTTVFVAQRR
jgi:hypothetical protein